MDEENNVIVGSGLINAYKLENVANYPRIIIDRNLIKLKFGNSQTAKILLKNHLRFDPPNEYIYDFPYLDYCKSISLFDFQVHKFDSIAEVVEKNFYKNEHITKYQWLRVHLVDSCTNSINEINKKDDSEKSKNDRRRIKLLNNFIENLESL